LIVFDVQAADSPVQVAGDGFPLRIGDQTLQVSESQIQALKLKGFVESWESRTSPMSPEQLDPALIARARQGAGLSALSDEEYLLKRKLADRRGARIQLRRAAELLFAADGSDHPNAGIRVFRVIGTERHTGPEHNVEELPRIEGNLPAVIEEAFSIIARLLRRPSRLFGSRFRAVPEYPEFSWKEALLNAVAHRDYSVEGPGTEIWLFEDRMEINSPGGLVGDLTLHNTPTLSAADREFVSRLDATELTDEEFRALLHAHRLGRVENGDLRLLVGLDTLKASYLLRRLRDRGLLELHARGANSFYTLPDVYTARSNNEEQNADRGKQNTDRVKQNANQRGQPAILPRQIRSAIADLTLRPRKEQLRQVILAVCAFREWTTPAELAIWLDILPDNLTVRHLSPMAERQAFDVCCQPDRSGVCCQQGTRHAQQIRLTMVFRTDSAVRSNGSESHWVSTCGRTSDRAGNSTSGNPRSGRRRRSHRVSSGVAPACTGTASSAPLCR
jgi:hypothetical protein